MRELIDFCKEHHMKIGVTYSVELDSVFIRAADLNTDDVYTFGVTTDEIQSVPGSILEEFIYNQIAEQFELTRDKEDEYEE